MTEYIEPYTDDERARAAMSAIRRAEHELGLPRDPACHSVRGRVNRILETAYAGHLDPRTYGQMWFLSRLPPNTQIGPISV